MENTKRLFIITLLASISCAGIWFFSIDVSQRTGTTDRLGNMGRETWPDVNLKASLDPFIFVNGNAQLAGVPGITGNGTEGNPYIIANKVIDAGGNGSAIWINNTNAYLVIYNCNLTNSGTGTTNAGIKLWNATNVNVSSNHCVFNQGNGMFVWSSHGCIISGNNLSSNTWRGLQMGYSNNCSVSGNIVEHNLNEGLYFFPADGAIVSDNVVSHNPTGIFTRATNYITLSGNNVSSCTVGIYLYVSGFFTITGNNVFDNSQDGLMISGGGNHIVSENDLHNNVRYGIYSHSGDDSVVYLNTLAGNSVANVKHDAGYITYWDNGTHGNYYDDYRSRSPGATGNGITWNTPYTIDDTQDSHPLIFPGGATNDLPEITSPADFTYGSGVIGELFRWNITDDTIVNATFIVYQNDVEILQGSWISGEIVPVTLTTILPDGVYTFRILVNDGCGYTVTDTVVITMGDLFPGYLPALIIGIVGVVAAVVAVALYKRRKKPRSSK